MCRPESIEFIGKFSLNRNELFKIQKYRQYLEETEHVDSSPDLLKLCKELEENSRNKREAAVAIFYLVRDIKWGASRIYRASEVLKRKGEPQICVNKAILQVALCRNLGIPARFHYWIIKFSDEVIKAINELLFKERRHKFRNAELHHVAAEIYLGKWIVTDSTIDKDLKPIFQPNEWNGEENALIRGFDFIRDRGVYVDVPRDLIEISKGKALPTYLRPFYPLIKGKINRQINQLLDRIQSLNRLDQKKELLRNIR